MQTMRVTPLLILAACSLEIQGTNALIPLGENSADPGTTPESGVAPGDAPPCASADGEIACDHPDASSADPGPVPDAGPNDGEACGGDGKPDCQDECPGDPRKTRPLLCGCGESEHDGDGDGTPDCVDGCPEEPTKTAQGLCGCDAPDVDVDKDGVIDCIDECIRSSDAAANCACDPALKECGNRPPTVALVGPSSDTVPAYNLCIRAEARDEDGTIEKVALFVDGKLLREERVAPYLWGGAGGSHPDDFKRLSAGVHVFMVRALDDQGATAEANAQITIMAR